MSGMTLNDPKDPWAQHMSAIEVYADVWCPFAHVGLHYVVERRSALGRGDVLLDIRAWPLELVNGAPLILISLLHMSESYDPR